MTHDPQAQAEAEAVAEVQLKRPRSVVEAVVLRGVACPRHEASLPECPDCLSGAQAHALGLEQVTHDLGVISDSKWRRLSVRQFLAARRIRKANARRN